MDMNLSKFREIVKDREAWHSTVCAVTELDMTKLLNWAELPGKLVHTYTNTYISSVQFSRSVVSDSLRPHESQHTRPPCPSPFPGVHSDSRPSSQWCHPAISSSVNPFFSYPQSLPASESFPMSQLFAWGGQSTRASALASFSPENTHLHIHTYIHIHIGLVGRSQELDDPFEL